MTRNSNGKNGLGIHISGSVKSKGTNKYQISKDVANWTRQEIAKECRRIFDTANKRITRLESSGALSPALHSVLKEGKFYSRGADLNKLRHEYSRAVAFLNMETSTVGGARKYERHLTNLMGGKLSDKQRSVLFDAFRRIKEVSPAGLMSYGSERLISYLADEIRSEDEAIENGSDVDFEAMVKKAMEEVTAAYEKMEADFDNIFKDIFSF